MLLRDLEGAKVATDVEDWMFHPNAPLPSGADHRGAKMLVQRELIRQRRIQRSGLRLSGAAFARMGLGVSPSCTPARMRCS